MQLMKSFMDYYLCLTIDQMILRSLCCLEPMEIHYPVASSLLLLLLLLHCSFCFFSPSSSSFNRLSLIITYLPRTSREVCLLLFRLFNIVFTTYRVYLSPLLPFLYFSVSHFFIAWFVSFSSSFLLSSSSN